MHGFVRTERTGAGGFAELGERLDAGAAIVDDDGCVSYANERMAQMCGLPGQCLEGYDLAALGAVAWRNASDRGQEAALGKRPVQLYRYAICAPGSVCQHLLMVTEPTAPAAQPTIDAFAERHALTEREGDILGHLLEGLPAKAIADRCGISVHTVRNHIKSVYRKVGVHSRLGLVRMARQMEESRER